MKNLKLNTDERNFKLKDEPFENILIHGNTINCFGIFYEDGMIDCMSMEEKDRKQFIWLINQIRNYNANVYIICDKKTVGYYQHILTWLDNHEVDISNVKLLKPDAKAEMLKQFSEL